VFIVHDLSALVQKAPPLRPGARARQGIRRAVARTHLAVRLYTVFPLSWRSDLKTKIKR
jgi:hypothetical protein